MAHSVCITIPDELRSVWKRIPNKSAWVTKHLRELGGFPVETKHTSWSPAIGMCNMYHKDGVCQTCLEELDMIEYDAITEYERRSSIYEDIQYHKANGLATFRPYWEESE
jgi:predicted Fe-S protein YdhL (DUF1289 family)